jgi:hypothetical protein
LKEEMYIEEMHDEIDEEIEVISKEEQFIKIYSNLTHLVLINAANIRDFIYNNKEYIYSTKIFDEDNNTMLQLSIGNSKVFKYLIANNLYDVSYLTHRNKQKNDFIMMCISHNKEVFQQIYSIINDCYNYNINKYINDQLHKILFLLIDHGWDDILLNVLSQLGDKYKSIARAWVSGPAKFRYTSPIKYLLKNGTYTFENNMTYNEFITQIFDKNISTDYTVNYIIKTFITAKNFQYVKLLINQVIPIQKKYIIELCLNTSDYFSIPFIKDMVIDFIIEDKYYLETRSRLFFIMENGNEIQLQQLLTIDNFSEEEFLHKDLFGNNCIFYAIKNNSEIVQYLTSCKYFNVELLKEKDMVNHIKKYANKSINYIYSLLYPEPEYIPTDYNIETACKICYENKVNIVLIPCGHTQCSKCINCKTTMCPFCFEPIENFQILHLS